MEILLFLLQSVCPYFPYSCHMNYKDYYITFSLHFFSGPMLF